MLDVVAIATCFNRREMTIRAVQDIQEQFDKIDDTRVNFVVVDDKSRDGSAVALRNVPRVKVIDGTGSLYWGGGMALASEHIGQPDLVLWFNDDIKLEDGAISALLRGSSLNPGAVIVGSLTDPESGQTTYGGYRVSRRAFNHSWSRITSGDHFLPADTFNGNLVLFPGDVHMRLGGPDSTFTHHYGDFDMGLRARAQGVPIFVAPGIMGQTARNSERGTFRDADLSASRRMRDLFGPKGFPMRERRVYYRRHAGWTWPVQWLGFYFYWLGRIAVHR